MADIAGLFLTKLLALKLGIAIASGRLVMCLMMSTHNFPLSVLIQHVVLGEISVNCLILTIKFDLPLYAMLH